MRPYLLAITLVLAACGAEDGSGEEGACDPEYGTHPDDDDPLVAETAWRNFESALDTTEVDDALAPRFAVPTDGQEFTAADAPTFEWAFAAANGRRRYHKGPTTGEVFLVAVDPDAGCPASFVTDGFEWPISADTWAALAAGDHAARVTYAYVTENVILEGDGPYRASADRGFTIEP